VTFLFKFGAVCFHCSVASPSGRNEAGCNASSRYNGSVLWPTRIVRRVKAPGTPLKSHLAAPVPPCSEGCRDSREISEPAAFKYIDLPEGPELRPSHLMRPDRELSRRKSIYLEIQRSVLPVFTAFPEFALRSAAGFQFRAGLRGLFFVLLYAGVLLRIPATRLLRASKSGR